MADPKCEDPTWWDVVGEDHSRGCGSTDVGLLMGFHLRVFHPWMAGPPEGSQGDVAERGSHWGSDTWVHPLLSHCLSDLEQTMWPLFSLVSSCANWYWLTKSSSLFCFLKNTYLFIWLHQVLVAACRVFDLRCGLQTLRCGTWDLVPLSGIEPRPPALGSRSLSHWATREVLPFCWWVSVEGLPCGRHCGVQESEMQGVWWFRAWSLEPVFMSLNLSAAADKRLPWQVNFSL